MNKENPKLTWKQKRFVEAYAGNGVKAAREAGRKRHEKTNSRPPRITRDVQCYSQRPDEQLA